MHTLLLDHNPAPGTGSRNITLLLAAWLRKMGFTVVEHGGLVPTALTATWISPRTYCYELSAWLPGREPGVAVFEGFMDYLSALTHCKVPYFACTVLLLNSVSLLAEALPQLLEAPMVHWYGDNDPAGERALRLLRQALPAGRSRPTMKSTGATRISTTS